MRLSFCLLFLFIFPVSYSIENADSAKTKLTDHILSSGPGFRWNFGVAYTL
jgi:hypothetical protein